MERFFEPIEKEGSAKKAAFATSKKDGEKTEISNEENSKKDPLKFVTWNANSLLLRAKNNWTEFSNFITSFHSDIIAMQEGYLLLVQKDAPKNPGELKDDTKPSREEKQILMHALSSPPFRNYQIWWSLADSKNAGTALLVKKCLQPKKVSFSLDKTASKHEPDGRAILAEFETFCLLNTYAPNNGWKEEENLFQRRRKWDKWIDEFVVQCSRSLLFVVVILIHEEIDMSHPEFFSAAKQNGYIPPNKEDCGRPGFTIAERKRFGAILKEGKLIDAYRFLNNEKDMDCGFSWSGNPIGKYQEKRMRIGYFIV